MEALYVEYCKSRSTADELLNRPDVIEFWEVGLLFVDYDFFILNLI